MLVDSGEPRHRPASTACLCHRFVVVGLERLPLGQFQGLLRPAEKGCGPSRMLGLLLVVHGANYAARAGAQGVAAGVGALRIRLRGSGRSDRSCADRPSVDSARTSRAVSTPETSPRVRDGSHVVKYALTSARARDAALLGLSILRHLIPAAEAMTLPGVPGRWREPCSGWRTHGASAGGLMAPWRAVLTVRGFGAACSPRRARHGADEAKRS